MNSLAQLLAGRRVLLSDGAWGTELAKRGLPAGLAPEIWNAERPDEIRAVAASYVEAGSDIILSCTFGGSSFKLAKRGLAGRAAELNRLGARLSQEAAAGRALVYASVGPTGEFMEPLGDVSEADMVKAYAQQVAALAEGGADGICIETMTDLGEARAALRAVRETCRLPAVVSMTFDRGPAGFATMMGVRPEQAAAELAGAGAAAVGANCGAGIADMIEIVRLMAPAAAGLPIWAKANAGLPELSGGTTVYRQTPEDFAKRAGELAAAGARIIGGCCGTTPEHIRALRGALGSGA
jgi:5-methyltetrahydrofolate--homocysteine methyltransferase